MLGTWCGPLIVIDWLPAGRSAFASARTPRERAPDRQAGRRSPGAASSPRLATLLGPCLFWPFAVGVALRSLICWRRDHHGLRGLHALESPGNHNRQLPLLRDAERQLHPAVYAATRCSLVREYRSRAQLAGCRWCIAGSGVARSERQPAIGWIACLANARLWILRASGAAAIRCRSARRAGRAQCRPFGRINTRAC